MVTFYACATVSYNTFLAPFLDITRTNEDINKVTYSKISMIHVHVRKKIVGDYKV